MNIQSPTKVAIGLPLILNLLFVQCQSPNGEGISESEKSAEEQTDSVRGLVTKGEVTEGGTNDFEKVDPLEHKRRKPLIITITNLKSATAPVIFSVYENEETYLKPDVHLKTYRFVPKGKTLKMKLTDLEYGTYAIAFYQDMNDSGDLDKNLLGIPKEPYAFTNDIRPKLKAPSFDDCKFIYSKKKNSIAVKMGK